VKGLFYWPQGRQHHIGENRMAHYLLFAYVVVLGLEVGAGLFTSVVVFPVWTASPEIVIGWKPANPYFMEEGNFFMFASTTTTLLAIALLIRRGRLPAAAQPWARSSALVFLSMAIATAAYYVPVQFRMQGDAGAQLPPGELAAMLQRFVALNWVRQVLIVGAFVAGVHALGLSYRATAAPGAADGQRLGA
jgi:hypothetical protein